MCVTISIISFDFSELIFMSLLFVHSAAILTDSCIKDMLLNSHISKSVLSSKYVYKGTGVECSHGRCRSSHHYYMDDPFSDKCHHRISVEIGINLVNGKGICSLGWSTGECIVCNRRRIWAYNIDEVTIARKRIPNGGCMLRIVKR